MLTQLSFEISNKVFFIFNSQRSQLSTSEIVLLQRLQLPPNCSSLAYSSLICIENVRYKTERAKHVKASNQCLLPYGLSKCHICCTAVTKSTILCQYMNTAYVLMK